MNRPPPPPVRLKGHRSKLSLGEASPHEALKMTRGRRASRENGPARRVLPKGREELSKLDAEIESLGRSEELLIETAFARGTDVLRRPTPSLASGL